MHMYAGSTGLVSQSRFAEESQGRKCEPVASFWVCLRGSPLCKSINQQATLFCTCIQASRRAASFHCPIYRPLSWSFNCGLLCLKNFPIFLKRNERRIKGEDFRAPCFFALCFFIFILLFFFFFLISFFFFFLCVLLFDATTRVACLSFCSEARFTPVTTYTNFSLSLFLPPLSLSLS